MSKGIEKETLSLTKGAPQKGNGVRNGHYPVDCSKQKPMKYISSVGEYVNKGIRVVGREKDTLGKRNQVCLPNVWNFL